MTDTKPRLSAGDRRSLYVFCAVATGDVGVVGPALVYPHERG